MQFSAMHRFALRPDLYVIDAIRCKMHVTRSLSLGLHLCILWRYYQVFTEDFYGGFLRYQCLSLVRIKFLESKKALDKPHIQTWTVRSVDLLMPVVEIVSGLSL
jgi:hypothetical protein